jgi:hypothetical protein
LKIKRTKRTLTVTLDKREASALAKIIWMYRTIQRDLYEPKLQKQIDGAMLNLNAELVELIG